MLKACVPGFEPQTPRQATYEDLCRAHSSEYVDVVRQLDTDIHALDRGNLGRWGFHSTDTPPFLGMYNASRAYVSGTVNAATDVRDGARLAFGIAGGLHHAHRSAASGFCVFNDPAIACSILRDSFERVAYIDIDLHHGDGVQGIFYDDPSVLTCSIHESGASLFPGTGFVDERGADGSAVNVPLEAGTTGDVWLWAFESGLMKMVERFGPEAIVLQMGTDAHFLDPLGNLEVSAQEWLAAVQLVKDLALPIVAVGGGGYEQSCVPRMWAAAVMTLAGIDFSDEMPDSTPPDWGMTRFFDQHLPSPRDRGKAAAESVVAQLLQL